MKIHWKDHPQPYSQTCVWKSVKRDRELTVGVDTEKIQTEEEGGRKKEIEMDCEVEAGIRRN